MELPKAGGIPRMVFYRLPCRSTTDQGLQQMLEECWRYARDVFTCFCQPREGLKPGLTLCYWASNHCTPAQRLVSASEEVNQDLSPWVLDSQKKELSKTANLSVFIPNRGNGWKNAFSSTSGKDGIFALSSRCDTAIYSEHLWITYSPDYWDSCLTNRKLSSTWVRSRDENVPGKIGKAGPAGYTHWKVAAKSTEDQVAWRHLGIAWYRLGVDPAEFSDLVKKCEVFRVFLKMLPRNAPQKKNGYEN